MRATRDGNQSDYYGWSDSQEIEREFQWPEVEGERQRIFQAIHDVARSYRDVDLLGELGEGEWQRHSQRCKRGTGIDHRRGLSGETVLECIMMKAVDRLSDQDPERPAFMPSMMPSLIREEIARKIDTLLKVPYRSTLTDTQTFIRADGSDSEYEGLLITGKPDDAHICFIDCTTALRKSKLASAKRLLRKFRQHCRDRISVLIVQFSRDGDSMRSPVEMFVPLLRHVDRLATLTSKNAEMTWNGFHTLLHGLPLSDKRIPEKQEPLGTRVKGMQFQVRNSESNENSPFND